ncbi:NAD/NADP octopine/nopaline dehydrogenase family protein [Nocardioides sp.]|uniref:NAD/NADP octopine/nopaline dehydrogenase family protein n=1 Tax=Nocardioides sp. TaxID=35761 RepID=UPI0039E31120
MSDTLVVLGDNPLVEVTAAYCSASSGTRVRVLRTDLGSTTPTLRELRVRTPDGATRSAQIASADEAEAAACSHVLVIANPRSLRRLLDDRPTLFEAADILIAPGNFAGAAGFRHWAREAGVDSPQVGELPGVAVFGQLTEDLVEIRHLKADLQCGGLCRSQGEALAASFGRWLPGLVGTHHHETSLANLNHVIHPPIMLANLSAIDRGEGRRFYRESLSEATGRLLEVVDSERCAISRSLTGESESTVQLFTRYYHAQGAAGESILELLQSFPGYELSQPPRALWPSYLTDDLPYGLAPMEELARRIGVATPTISSIITVFESATGLDVRSGAGELVDRLLHAGESPVE